VPLIQSKVEANNWLTKRLAQEGPGLWTDREREELGKKLAQDYRREGSQWRVTQWTQQPENISVHVVTRGGRVGIHTVDDREKPREKADAIMRALNALDAEMKPASDLSS
jgi:hypothetical protein